MSQFGHSYQLISNTFNHIVKCVNGIDRIIAFYKEDNEDLLKGVGLKQQGMQMVEEVIEIAPEYQSQLKNFITDCKSYKWLDKQLIPFEERQQQILQLNIFDEYKYLILALSLKLNHKTQGILFIYFKDDIAHFGVHHSKEPLSTQQKSIIAHILWNSICSFISDSAEQNEKFKQFAQNAHLIIKKQSAINQNNVYKDYNSKFIISWAQSYLEELTKYEAINYVYSDACIDKIKSYNGTFEPLQCALKDGIEFAKTMFTYVNSNICQIEPYYIAWPQDRSEDLNTQDDVKVNPNYPDQYKTPRMQKTIDFLNKLEESSIQVFHSEENLTSANVGKSMPKPITAAAISDFLSKNKERINQLFIQFPNEWEFIRNHFRPIINISDKNISLLKNWG